MNVKFKALVAAVALTLSGVASANVVLPGTGDTHLYFSIIDKSTKASAFFDLGTDFGSFTSFNVANGTGSLTDGTTFSWDLTTGDANTVGSWANVLANFDLTSTDIRWGVWAGDSSAADGKGWISTIADNTTLSAVSDTQLNNAIGNANNNWVKNQKAAQAATYTLSSSNAASSAGASAYTGNGKFGGIGNIAYGSVGSTLTVASLFNADSSSSGAADYHTLTNSLGAPVTFTFSDTGTLVYEVSTIPEANTASMMLAGLGLMGVVAVRRRKQA